MSKHIKRWGGFVATALLAGSVAALVPQALAAPPSGNWQVYTMAHGLVEQPTFQVAPDGAGGLWVGHVAGGRGIGRAGGLVHVPSDGNGALLRGEPFSACSSVDELALASNATLWFKLSGYHDYGSSDYGGRCAPSYGAGIGSVAPDGTVRVLPLDQQPTGEVVGLAVDAQNRPWIGTGRGVAVRDADGTWREIVLWGDGEGTTTVVRASADGTRLVAGSSAGAIGTIGVRAGQPEFVGVRPYPSADRTQPVFDLAFVPTGGLAVVVGNQLFLESGDEGSWRTIALPAVDIYGARLAFAGGKLWLALFSYPTGLFYLGDDGAWLSVPAGETPLPGAVVTDLYAASENVLLMATDKGAARLDLTGVAPDANDARGAFTRLWERTNRGAGDSWVWGPFAWAERYEPYQEGPGGVRYVRYYDKARMEVPRPEADPANPWYVTNGLLVVEMVRGKAQLGDNPNAVACPLGKGSEVCPAFYPVAGDADSNSNSLAPTYGEFAPLLTPASSRVGQRVGTTYTQPNAWGTFELGENGALASEATTIAAFDQATSHNIPQVFWAFMNRQPTDWLFAFGHPIAEPVWVRTAIGGVERDVLVQLFERRVLTYTPSNEAAWQVEMGNVGQHYFAWRYGTNQQNPVWAQPLPR
jgi:hypothetical protein